VLDAPATVREVARNGDQLGVDPLDERRQIALDSGLFDAPGMEIGDVEEPHGQRRSRLYTGIHGG
jgi:hypothetical protein